MSFRCGGETAVKRGWVRRSRRIMREGDADPLGRGAAGFYGRRPRVKIRLQGYASIRRPTDALRDRVIR